MKNILFVTYDFPFPISSGGKNRAYNLLKYTAKEANIYLYSFVREDFSPEYIEEMRKINIKEVRVTKRKKLSSIKNVLPIVFTDSSIFKTLYFNQRNLSEMIDIIKEKKIDVVHFESSYTGFYIGKEIAKTKAKQILGTENIEFKLYQDYAKSLKKIYLKPFVNHQAKRLEREELEMVRTADCVTTITKSEADFLKNMTQKECKVIANGIDPVQFDFKFDKKIKKNLLFVGNFTYFPNIDAVNFIYKNIFDKLDRDLTLTIIGKKCKEKLKFNDKRIIMKDFVDDLILEYRNADILLFPIRIGGGTNFKVLEAMSLGLPIIANAERLAGLEVMSGEHFLEAATGDEYIAQIDKLYKDIALREKISVNSRKVIEKYYAWNAIGKKLINIWNEV